MLQRHLDATDGHVGVVQNMVTDHLAIVHLVDMIAGKHQHILRIVAAQNVEVLEHRVGGTFVPSGLQALLRR